MFGFLVAFSLNIADEFFFQLSSFNTLFDRSSLIRRLLMWCFRFVFGFKLRLCRRLCRMRPCEFFDVFFVFDFDRLNFNLLRRQQHLHLMFLSLVFLIGWLLVRLSSECIRFVILLSGLVRDLEVELGQEFSLSCLPRCQLLCRHEVLKALMVSQHFYWHGRAF